MIRIETAVRAPLDEVWRAWTTSSGMAEFHPPGASIDLRVGGAWDVAFDLDEDAHDDFAEGGRVVSYLPRELLSVEWTSRMPSGRELQSRVVVLFERMGRSTRVKLAHLRLHDDEGAGIRQHLEQSWRTLLGELEQHYGRSDERPSRRGRRPRAMAMA